MFQAIKRYKSIYLSYLILVLIGLIILLNIEKGDAVYYLNGMHTPKLDRIFSAVTMMGEYLGFGIILLLCIAHQNWRRFIAFLITCLLMLGLISLFKHIIFSDAMRPSVILGPEGLHFVEGLHINRKFSFPSGHTTAAFTYFTFVAFMLPGSRHRLVQVGLAALVGLSRIYLAQHFLEDVIAGSLLGILIASFGYLVISEKWLKKFPALSQKIIPFGVQPNDD